MNIKKIIKDVRGAALVYVIVAAAIVILLGTATTTTAYVTLRATQIQEQSHNNFYSADTIMNAIISGLEGDISEAYRVAYSKVIANINSYTKTEDGDIYDAAYADFYNTFMYDEQYGLRSVLDDKTGVFDAFYDDQKLEGHAYNVKRIQGYAEKVLGANANYTISALNGLNFMDITADNNGLILRNLHVTYEDESGYYDEITTDIKITVPEFNPQFIQQKDLQLNAFVADNGLELKFDTGMQIDGNVYINTIDIVPEEDDPDAEKTNSVINLKQKSGLSIISPNEMVLDGEIVTDEDTRLFLGGTGANADDNLIWVDNMTFGRFSDVNITGQIFVADDMEVNGAYSKIRLAGEYYGYGQSYGNSNESSAININGAHTTLDIQDLDMLVLAGSSYLSTSTVKELDDSAYVNSKDMQLGEALSIKSNQIAYFVDDNEFINEAKVPNFVSNPMSYGQYEIMCDLNGDKIVTKEEQDDVLSDIAGKKLSYGWSYSEYGATVTPVFSGQDGGTVYLYLDFVNPAQAAKFFTDVYAGDSLLSQRLRAYADQYISNLNLGDHTSVLVNENYIYKTPTGELAYTRSAPDEASMDSLIGQIRFQYFGNEEEEIEGKKGAVTYQKMIVDETSLANFINAATDPESKAYTDANTNNKVQAIQNGDNTIGVILSGTSNAKAIIINNKNGNTYKVEEGEGIVIASGDVEITGNWTGTIVVGGRVYVNGGTKENPLKFTVNSSIVSSVLPLYFANKADDDTITYTSVINLFRNYENFKVNDSTKDKGVNADMISNCITFTNWDRY